MGGHATVARKLGIMPAIVPNQRQKSNKSTTSNNRDNDEEDNDQMVDGDSAASR